ncbi:MAG: arginase family protein [Bdellovibrionales bacterium]|nr:arginase family protein [Bdellovibrionales bacterium]
MMESFDEGLTGSYKNGLFGIPAKKAESKVVIAPVPWDTTTSYGKGTSKGPQAILQASPQIDLFDFDLENSWKKGYYWDDALMPLEQLNNRVRPLSEMVMSQLEESGQLSPENRQLQSEVNSACKSMVGQVYEFSKKTVESGKLLGLVGGDHSTPEGYLKLLSERLQGDFGILHIDAHHDLRVSYQGFDHSHASIMHNVMSLPQSPNSLVQVGIRDFSQQEYNYSERHPKIKTFWDRKLKAELFAGKTWSDCCSEIIASLPERVYVSFDIDGLSPEFCPSTGTPVPGGLSYDQAVYLLASLGKSGKTLIGFDLNEVAPSSDGNEWDANVGCRLLFQLCGWLAESDAKL